METKKIIGLEIKPKISCLKIGETKKLEAIAQYDNGARAQVPASWQCAGGGYISVDGTLKTNETTGTYKVYATVTQWDDEENASKEILAEAKFVVVAEEEEKTMQVEDSIRVPGVSEVIRKSQLEKKGDRVFDEIVKAATANGREKIALRERSDEELSEIAKQNQHRSMLSHTRAIYRTLAANKDLVWLGFLCIFAVAFGGCVILLLNGFSIEKIGALLGLFIGFIVSLLGKIYTPEGEVSEALSDKISGATDEEKLKALEQKVLRITTKLQKKKQKGNIESFYKLTRDENSQY